MRRFVPFDFKYDRGKSRNVCEEMPSHEELEERLRKTFYYGGSCDIDSPSLPLTELAVDYFHSSVPRKLGSIDREMASTMTRNACVSPCSVMMSMIYVRRLRQNNTDYLHQVSSSDLFFISMMMASKYLYDEGVDEEVFNDEWAESAKQELSDVNEMEKEFLTAMDWQLFVKEEEFMELVAKIEERIAWTQGFDRGWLTYTDLSVLLNNPTLKWLLFGVGQDWVKVVTVGSAAYVAGVFTMIGATILALQMSTILSVAMTTLVLQQQSSPLDPIRPSSLPALLPSSAPGDFHNRTGAVRDEISLDERNVDPNSTEPVSSRPTPAEMMMRGSFFEQVLPQLWVVMALRDHFVQFMCAVTQSCRSALNPRRCAKSPQRRHHHCWSNADKSAAVVVHDGGYGNFGMAVDHGNSRIANVQNPTVCNRLCPCCCQEKNRFDSHMFVTCVNTGLRYSSSNLCSSCVNLRTENCRTCRRNPGSTRRRSPSCYHGNRPPDHRSWMSPVIMDVMLGFATGNTYQINVAA